MLHASSLTFSAAPDPSCVARWTRSLLRRLHPTSCAQSEERDPWQNGWTPLGKPLRLLVFWLPGSSRCGSAAPSRLLCLLRLSGSLQRSLAASIALQSYHLLVGDIHLLGDVPALLPVERIHVVHQLLECQPLGRRHRLGLNQLPMMHDASDTAAAGKQDFIFS